MKKLLALGLACCAPLGLAAEDPNESTAYLGTVSVIVMDESTPIATECGRAAECIAVHRAVLTARIKKVSALRERGRWM
jgi:hypothetical protein